MRRFYHMSVSLEGLIINYKRRKINFFEDDNGRPLTDKEAREEIARLQALGHKLMCCSSECEGFDPFGKGCPGHDMPDDQII